MRVSRPHGGKTRCKKRPLQVIVGVEELDERRASQFEARVPGGAGASVWAGLPADAVAEALDDVEAVVR